MDNTQSFESISDWVEKNYPRETSRFSKSSLSDVRQKLDATKLNIKDGEKRVTEVNNKLSALKLALNIREAELSGMSSSLAILQEIEASLAEALKNEQLSGLITLNANDIANVFKMCGNDFLFMLAKDQSVEVYFYKPTSTCGEAVIPPVIYNARYSFSSGKVRFSGVTAYPTLSTRRDSNGSGYDSKFHPHISSLNGDEYSYQSSGRKAFYGNVCTGNFIDVLSTHKTGDDINELEDHMILLNTLLNTYSPASPYIRPDQINKLYNSNGIVNHIGQNIYLPSTDKSKYILSPDLNVGIINAYISSGKLPIKAVVKTSDIRDFLNQITVDTENVYEKFHSVLSEVSSKLDSDSAYEQRAIIEFIDNKFKTLFYTTNVHLDKIIAENTPLYTILNLYHSLPSVLENLTKEHGSSINLRDVLPSILEMQQILENDKERLMHLKIPNRGSLLSKSYEELEKYIKVLDGGTPETPESDSNTSELRYEYAVDDEIEDEDMELEEDN